MVMFIFTKKGIGLKYWEGSNGCYIVDFSQLIQRYPELATWGQGDGRAELHGHNCIPLLVASYRSIYPGTQRSVWWRSGQLIIDEETSNWKARRLQRPYQGP